MTVDLNQDGPHRRHLWQRLVATIRKVAERVAKTSIHQGSSFEDVFHCRRSCAAIQPPAAETGFEFIAQELRNPPPLLSQLGEKFAVVTFDHVAYPARTATQPRTAGAFDVARVRIPVTASTRRRYQCAVGAFNNSGRIGPASEANISPREHQVMSMLCCRRPCRGQFRHAVKMTGRSTYEGVPCWRERLLACFRANIAAWAGVLDGHNSK